MSLTFERTEPIQYGLEPLLRTQAVTVYYTIISSLVKCQLVSLCSIPPLPNLQPLTFRVKALVWSCGGKTSYVGMAPILPCFSSEPINSWQNCSLSVVTNFVLRKMGKSCHGFTMPREIWMWLPMRCLPGFSVIRRS